MNYVTDYNRLFVGVGVLALVLVGAYSTLHSSQKAAAIQHFEQYIRDTKSPYSYTADAAAYATLLKSIGPVEAQGILASSTSAARGHMVNHLTGAALYKEYGQGGITRCKPSLTGSCYHGFIAAAVLDQGLDHIEDVAHACETLIPDDALQCKHGIGHGFLEYVGFNHLPDALELCKGLFVQDTVGQKRCFDGVFMENAANPLNIPPIDRLYRASDPMYPCNEPSIVAIGAHQDCWDHNQAKMTLRKNLYPTIGGNVQKAFTFCASLTNAGDTGTCAWGVAWQIFQQSPTSLTNAVAKCSVLTKANNKNLCTYYVAQNAYYYGDVADGSRSDALMHICMNMSASDKNTCYETVFYNGIGSLYSDRRARLAACSELPESNARAGCVVWMDARVRQAQPSDADLLSLTKLQEQFEQPAPIDTSNTFYPQEN